MVVAAYSAGCTLRVSVLLDTQAKQHRAMVPVQGGQSPRALMETCPSGREAAASLDLEVSGRTATAAFAPAALAKPRDRLELSSWPSVNLNVMGRNRHLHSPRHFPSAYRQAPTSNVPRASGREQKSRRQPCSSASDNRRRRHGRRRPGIMLGSAASGKRNWIALSRLRRIGEM